MNTEETTKDIPTKRISLVLGQHCIASALELLHVITLARPELEDLTEQVKKQLRPGLQWYRVDVENLEAGLKEKEKEAQDYATKVVEVSAALEMEKERFQQKCDEVERLHDRLHEKNTGFVEAIQEKNRQYAELEAKCEMFQLRMQTAVETEQHLQRELNRAQETVENLIKRNSEHWNRCKQLVDYIKRKGFRVPKAFA